jgi:hypothetical protein
MMFFGFSIVYGLRVNLSVAMVAMVNGTKSQPSLNSSGGHECPVSSHGNGSQTPDQPDGVSTSSSQSINKTYSSILYMHIISYFINWVVRDLNVDWLTAVVYQTVYQWYGKTFIDLSGYVGNQFIIAIRHLGGL